MNNLSLFRVAGNSLEELAASSAASEKDLHLLVERNLDLIFGIALLGREYPTGRTHRGFIDSLGLDSSNCPVIIEYKRKANENVISQGLFYLDWLFDHKAEFTDLAIRKIGQEVADSIDFANARLICVAASFSRFDERAIQQIDRAITLVRYEFFGGDLLALESLDNFISPFSVEAAENQERQADATVGMPPALQFRLKNMRPDNERLYLALLDFAEQLGEDITIKFLKHYIALQRKRNFTCVQPYRSSLKLWLNLEPEEVELEAGFSRNVRDIGHHATGNLEIELKTVADLEKAKPLIALAYNSN